MLRKISLIAVLALFGWTGAANATLVGACTFPGGCGPDFNIVGSGSFISYTYNAGSDTGVLSITGTVGNASFLDGQLDPVWQNTLYSSGPNAGNPYGRTSLNVIPATGGNDNFTMSLAVDGSGNLTGSSSITMNGKVMVFDGAIQTALSANGTPLDGNLITGGYIDALGWTNTVIDFLGAIDAGSLLALAGYGPNMGGVITLTPATITSSTGYIVWNESWSASGTMDVVVPVPAAVWLFMSGLLGLISLSRRQAHK